MFDCDPPGRHAARRIAGDLHAAGVTADVIDLAPGRADGYDLTDWLADRDRVGAGELAAAIDALAGARVSARRC